MAIDYAQMTPNGPADTAAARAPVVSFERVKPKRLTKNTKSALLRRRNAEKNTMAKKRRTAKQIAATKKLVRLNKARPVASAADHARVAARLFACEIAEPLRLLSSWLVSPRQRRSSSTNIRRGSS